MILLRVRPRPLMVLAILFPDDARVQPLLFLNIAFFNLTREIKEDYQRREATNRKLNRLRQHMPVMAS